MHDFQIKDYAYQIWKRRNVVLIFMGATLLLTVLFTLRQPRTYRAVATIEIGAETPDAFFQDVVNVSPYGWWSALKYYETQYQILKSRSLMEKVAQRAIDRKILTGMSAGLATGLLQGGLSVGSDDKSRLAQVYFDDSDPKQASSLANLIAEVYVDENLAHKLQGFTQAINWLNERLGELRKEKLKQEDELQKFKEQYKVVSVADRENSARANLDALAQSVNRLKGQRIEYEAQFNKLRDLVEKSGQVEDLTGVVSNDLLTKLKQDLSALRTEKSKLAHRYLDRHPTMVRLNAEVDEVEKAIRQEVANEVGRLKTKFLLTQAQENEVSKALEKQKLEALKMDTVNRRVADIQAVTNMNQQLFEALQKKLKEVDLSALLRSNNIRIVDKALESEVEKIRPKVKTNVLLALMVGLLGGIALALALEYLDDTIKTHEDVERYLSLAVLGAIPHYGAAGNGGGKTLDFAPADDPSSALSEFFRTLRTNLLFLSTTTNAKRILFVSTGPAEGKTSIAINLAVTLAQMGQKTVIVELDLRRPKFHNKFTSPDRDGITNVLVGEMSLDRVLRRSEVPNLDFLLAGMIPPNPAELLASEGLRSLLEDLSRRYDRVIIDSSPIAPVTDAVIISQSVEGVVLVIRAAKTHRRAVKLALEQLRAVQAPLMGVVLNDIEIEKSSYGNYQYYKYGYAVYTDSSAAPPKPTDISA